MQYVLAMPANLLVVMTAALCCLHASCSKHADSLDCLSTCHMTTVFL